MYAETSDAASVQVYPVPESLKSLAEDDKYLVVSGDQRVEAVNKQPAVAPVSEPQPKKEIDSL